MGLALLPDCGKAGGCDKTDIRLFGRAAVVLLEHLIVSTYCIVAFII